jgi:hypothetical protein
MVAARILSHAAAMVKSPAVGRDRCSVRAARGLLSEFLERVLAHQVEPLPLEGRFPAAGQKAVGERLMRALGFDFVKAVWMRACIRSAPECPFA